MGQTYTATAINLKSVPLGETDRLLTLLSADQGLLRAVAPGSRKHQSRLGGRSDLFVVNTCLLVKGKSLDRLVQAETQRTFSGLSQHLGRLTASQYLAELVLMQALDATPQPELFNLLVEHLQRLEASPPAGILAALVQGVYHLLALGGIAPITHRCCLSQAPIVPDLLTPNWQVGFSAVAGGLVLPAAVTDGMAPELAPILPVSAPEVVLLQQLSRSQTMGAAAPGPTGSLSGPGARAPHQWWGRIERLLRQYAQYQFERPIRSATLRISLPTSPA